MAKKLDPICKNCRLFDPNSGRCAVIILHNNERYNLPVDPDDECFFEQKFMAINEDCLEEFKVEVQQVKFWVEDPETGEKTDGHGRVCIEYPEGFFGKEID